MAVPIFDDYLMVDWSASDRPRLGRDSIWICRGRPTRRPGAPVLEWVNSPTRSHAEAVLHEMFLETVGGGRRLFVGVDFPLALAEGFGRFCSVVRELSTDEGLPSWLAWWQWLETELDDDLDGTANRSNRFEVADRLNKLSQTRYFWGRPTGHRYEELASLPPRDVAVPGLTANPCARLRLSERLAGRGIKPAWQLFGGVTVGSQMLTGIPRLACLRRSLPVGAVAVWPFEQAQLQMAQVVIAEAWPSLFATPDALRSEQAASGGVRDQVQVSLAVRAFSAADDEGTLESWLRPSEGGCTASLLAEEGWILGVLPDDRHPQVVGTGIDPVTSRFSGARSTN